METDYIVSLAKAYDEVLWSDFVSCFPKVEVNDVILKGIPNDIVSVLVALMGNEEAKAWVCKPLERLDNQMVRDLVKSDTGLKATKMFVLSMRI